MVHVLGAALAKSSMEDLVVTQLTAGIVMNGEVSRSSPLHRRTGCGPAPRRVVASLGEPPPVEVDARTASHWVVLAALVIDALSLSPFERIREIGLLRAVGLTVVSSPARSRWSW